MNRFLSQPLVCLSVLLFVRTIGFSRCLAPVPSPSRRFGPANKVKERLYCLGLQRLSGLNRHLCLSIVWLRRLAPRVISQSVKKVKEQPSCRLVLCLSGLTKASPLFYCLAASAIGSGHKPIASEGTKRLLSALVLCLSPMSRRSPPF
jgi:hypothetical protein